MKSLTQNVSLTEKIEKHLANYSTSGLQQQLYLTDVAGRIYGCCYCNVLLQYLQSASA